MSPLVLITLIGAALAAPAPRVLGAAHHGERVGEDLEWTTTVVLAEPSDGRLELALPLPERVTWVPVEGISPVLDLQGQVVAVDLLIPHKRFSLKVHERSDAHTIAPPLLDTDAVQRVTLSGAWFQADPVLGLQKHLAYQAHPDIEGAQRRAIDRMMNGSRSGLEDQPLYLMADARVRTAGALRGELRPAGARSQAVAIATAGTFAVVLALLFGLARVLERVARREKVDAYIRSELG
ncbi:MAG: hypothetical protein H6739_22065 [Alphaproteobacteria bacterium]|nr:hypothetical protein [Alphaproteobacteria bacterium]